MKKAKGFLLAACMVLATAFTFSCGGGDEDGSSSKTGAYIEASRNETFSLCPEKKIDGTWISEHSVALDEKNCLTVQAPNLAGTFRILFMENSGLTDTIQVLVEQSYIQMGDYSHIVYVVDSAEIKANAGYPGHPAPIYIVAPGKYESRSYSQPLIVDKTKFTVGDWQYYFNQEPYKDEKIEESKLPLVYHLYQDQEGFAWRLANERSKKEGLDTAYFRDAIGRITLDASASGYRLPSGEEWYFLMRAGASTKFFWGNEGLEDSLKISRYAWIQRPGTEKELKPVAQLLPNGFGLYDMIGIAPEYCDSSPESFFVCTIFLGGGVPYKSFRLLRKTPKLHKLEKF